MKRFFKQLGKAACYLGVFFYWQIALSVAFTLGAMAQFGAYNEQAMLDYVLANTDLITVLSGALTLASYAVIFALRKKSFGKEAGFGKLQPALLLPLVLMGLCFNALVGSAMELFFSDTQLMADYIEASASLSQETTFLQVLSIVVAAPLAEEAAFRGLVYTRLKKGCRVWIAALLQALVFGIAHGTFLWFLYTFLFGLVLGIAFERAHSLWASILLHAAFNGANYLLMLLGDVNLWLVFAIGLTGFCAMLVLFLWLCKNYEIQHPELLQGGKPMKIVCVLGSPRAESLSTTIAQSFIKGAKESGHEVVIYDVNKLNVRGCQGCGYCKANEVDCILEDDLKPYWKDLHECGALVVTAPNYCSQICGPMITYMNRHYCLITKNGVRVHPGIKLYGIFSQGYDNLTAYDKAYDWFLGDFQNRDMVLTEKFVASPRMPSDDLAALIKRAYEAGKAV